MGQTILPGIEAKEEWLELAEVIEPVGRKNHN